MFNWFKKSKTCPNCHLDSSWDGHKCIRCGYIENLAKKKPALLAQVMDLFDPKTYNPQDLYYKKQLIPERPGVYAWYFDHYFSTLFHESPEPKVDFIELDIDRWGTKKWFLLYVGVAGEKKERTLRDRIFGDHLNKNSKGSTFRQTLAALLYDELGLDPKKQLKGEDEKSKLNKWIFKHSKVAWVETDNPEKVESIMFEEFGQFLYFNIKGNRKNRFRKKLEHLRKYWRKSGTFWARLFK
ncbi:MAG TPA: hypothetical protein VMW16_06295 [Sedimentisphaerales bacterium]|nr:hypothetical protein [Sedimentisphaerales bacterium]